MTTCRRRAAVLPLGATVFAILATSLPARAQETLRPAVGRPLQQAEADMRRRAFPRAMAEVNAADAVGGKSAYETYVIAQLRAAIAQQSGNLPAAISADDALIASPRTPETEKTRLLTAEAGLAYTAHDYPRAVTALERYFKAGGNDPQMHTLLIQSYYLQRDFPNAARAQQRQIAAEERAGQRPTENQLNLLASVQTQSHDLNGFNETMVQLVRFYPKPLYWAQLVHGLQTNPDIPDRLQYDIDRIRLAVGLLSSTADYMDMTELAVQQGYPVQAQRIMAQGYATGALGRDAGAPREARLKALVDQAVVDLRNNLAVQQKSAEAAPYGDDLVKLGSNLVDLGQSAAGLAMMRRGLAEPKLLLPDDARLHYGLANDAAGQKPQAIAVLKGVGGTGPVHELAELWMLKIG